MLCKGEGEIRRRIGRGKKELSIYHGLREEEMQPKLRADVTDPS